MTNSVMATYLKLPSVILALTSIFLTYVYLVSKPFSPIPDSVAVPGVMAIVALTNLAAVFRFISASFREQAPERKTIETLIFVWAVSLHGVAITQAVT
ncbi:MAG: hypothetical protein ACQRW7_08510 [Caulobacterales bacterium]|uniref:hypothetical protein n=1 Tax=Glycocaulis sp. TaxID=1969725 RepID=UPI003F9F6A38